MIIHLCCLFYAVRMKRVLIPDCIISFICGLLPGVSSAQISAHIPCLRVVGQDPALKAALLLRAMPDSVTYFHLEGHQALPRVYGLPCLLGGSDVKRKGCSPI